MVNYKDLVLWGHSLADYINMFSLNEENLQSKILNCYSGPNSFNAELTSKGGEVVSCDPLFALSINQLKSTIQNEFQKMLTAIKAHQDRFVWNHYQSPEALAKARKANLENFLQDYELGKNESRYITCELPHLDFQHFQFDLAICSHYFFAYCPDPSIEFHLKALQSLANVAKEVRIFPLLNTQGEIPTLLGPLMLTLQQLNYGVEVKSVPYEFQKKGNAMLCIYAQTCEVK